MPPRIPSIQLVGAPVVPVDPRPLPKPPAPLPPAVKAELLQSLGASVAPVGPFTLNASRTLVPGRGRLKCDLVLMFNSNPSMIHFLSNTGGSAKPELLIHLYPPWPSRYLLDCSVGPIHGKFHVSSGAVSSSDFPVTPDGHLLFVLEMPPASETFALFSISREAGEFWFTGCEVTPLI